MTVRQGMNTLITQMRIQASAQPDEFTLAGETYWSDQNLQDVLDRYREDAYREILYPQVTYDVGNALQYFNYYWKLENVEESTSGTAIWFLQDPNGSAIGTADYTVNYEAQHIRFNASTQGAVRYLTYRAYDLNRAVAEVWSQKAASVAGKYNISTDNHTLNRSDLIKHYIQMADTFRRRAGGRSRRFDRVDLR